MTIHPLLESKLEPLVRRQQGTAAWSRLALAWFIAAGFCIALIALQHWLGWSSVLAVPLGVVVGAALTVFTVLRSREQEPDWRSLAREIETAHSELDGRLLTAIQLKPGSDGELNILQHRVLEEALAHDERANWAGLIPRSRLLLVRAAGLCALGLFAFALWNLRIPGSHGILVANDDLTASVSPGDVMLERGSSLVVMARFAKALPARVELVLEPPIQGTRRIQLFKSLADPLFGGTVPDLDSNVLYHLEYAGRRTRDFKATVFEYPRLERADADISFPPYTGLGEKHIDNTRRLSAVEGSRARLNLQFNKIVAQATLVSRGTNRTAIPLTIETNRPFAALKDFPFETSKIYELQLLDAEGRTNKVPAQFVFDVLKNRLPELKILSPAGDTRPSALEEISFDGTVWDDFGVQGYGLSCSVAGKETKTFELGKNVPGKEKRPFHLLVRGEELGLRPDDLINWFAWAEDIGPDGKVRRTSGDLYFAEVRPFDEIFREGQSMSGGDQQQSGAAGGQAGRAAETQKQIISATWNILRKHNPTLPPALQGAEAPTSSPALPLRSERSSSLRRTEHDRLTARSEAVGSQHFFGARWLFAQENTAQTPPRRSGAPRPGARASGPERTPALADDLNVVLEAQEHVLEQAETAKDRQRDPNFAALWEAAAKQMERALERLRAATNSPSELQPALAAEQAAYQALLKLQEREYSVSRSRNRQSGQNNRQQQMRNQLDQLDLSKAQDRYETERQAKPPQTPERSEQLQVMNRLQELARRQQDINERLKELQTALLEAQSEKQREEIRRQLKRLQEDEQELVANADELRQRMDRPENQSRMSEQRRQWEQARNDLERASEAAQQGQPSQALASGTRAQQQFQQMREDMRQQNAGEFGRELRQMRNDARELAQRQEEIQKKMDAMNDSKRRTLSDADLNKESLEELSRQHQRLTNLVEQATQLSQQAEGAEPLMSRELYDILRKFSQDDLSTLKQFQEELMNRGMVSRELFQRLKQTEQSGAKSLDLTAELLRQGLSQEAAVAQERARAGINDLKRGVERAAESVLGDEAQALGRARDELEQLAQQLSQEIARGEGGQTNQLTESSAAASAPQDEAQPPRQQNRGDSQGSEQPGRESQQGQNGNQQQDRPESSELAGNQQGQSGSGNARNRSSSRLRDGAQANSNAGGNRNAPNQNADGRRGGTMSLDFDRLMEGRGGYDGGPITGEDFAPWSDRLREVEELVETPAWRADVARARERARQMRQDFKRGQRKPDWAAVRLQVLKPLVEVRDQLAEELARREPRENLVPIDRDPVPGRYSELVRRYYEELGKDNRARSDAAPSPK